MWRQNCCECAFKLLQAALARLCNRAPMGRWRRRAVDQGTSLLFFFLLLFFFPILIVHNDDHALHRPHNISHCDFSFFYISSLPPQRAHVTGKQIEFQKIYIHLYRCCITLRTWLSPIQEEHARAQADTHTNTHARTLPATPPSLR